ncbi:hypothetical protein [Pelomicrobium methylotrophicum]|nr:hypothetical protein [Pelomicrobium methylotrophicum]
MSCKNITTARDQARHFLLNPPDASMQTALFGTIGSGGLYQMKAL